MEYAEGVEKKRGRLTFFEGRIFFLYALMMNLWVYPMLILLTLIGITLFPVLFVLVITLTGWNRGRIMRLFIWWYGRAWLVINTPFVRFSREGFDTIELPRPSILVINHLSFFDIYCMGLFPHSDAVFAVRSWPYKLFWYAPFMHLAQYINLERVGWQGAFEKGRKIFSQKGSVLFFPEGHRSRDGRLQRFFSGPFKLAVETGVPIVPLCISGTEVLLPPGRRWMRPAWVRLAVLPPVDPKGYEGPLGHIALKKQIKAQMAEKLSALGRS